MPDGSGFPFSTDRHVHLNGRDWGLLVASLALGFGLLTALPQMAFPASLIPPLLFMGIPLLSLRLVAGQHWVALFGRVGLRQVALMVLFGALTLVVSLSVGLLLARVAPLSANPFADRMQDLSAGQLAMLLIPTIPQLIGEELLGILPFLATLWLCIGRFGLSQGWGVICGVMVSASVFGAAHLPTYDWNWAQALIGIGSARVVLTLAYVVTRSLWVSAGAHVLNDWTGFLAAFAFGHLPIGADPI
ncbi:CPBP family intramembrane metalloprotease [Paracoccus sp. TK19116]|uniref:CPBP family intramembrane metalloprotease n=1 Tax=Paracoccus albicereus TaxID=2922394 RepID=A0ABT1MWT8_9RHOB|nr:CPBP family intramembrane glutamic endopeptidase [Paracoccus albicereus]MCQ0971976.1 CPBP family intramembrane metalloprotease [Paracoccus albicereus]